MSMDAGQLAESYRRDAERRLAGYRRLRAAIEELAVTARSPDGGVRVTVRVGGAVSELTLTEGALRQGAGSLGRQIQTTIQQAHRVLAARLARRARACLGSGFDVVGLTQGRPVAAAGAAAHGGTPGGRVTGSRPAAGRLARWTATGRWAG